MISYVLGRGLYIALTNRCNATPLFTTRGPGFKITSTQFAPLPPGLEPSPSQVVAEVESVLTGNNIGKFDSVVFAGLGEPTLRLPELLEISQILKRGAAKDMLLRLSTNGLANHVHARNIVPELTAAGIAGVTVALNTGCAEQYIELMKPETEGATLAAVVEFVRACLASGKLEVECTVVADPQVDIPKAQALAESLGVPCRLRSYHPLAVTPLERAPDAVAATASQPDQHSAL